MRRTALAPLLAALLLAGCVVAPADHDQALVVAPALPAVVEFDVYPYYFYGGFYYFYHEHDHAWRYARSKGGPWRDLPRDRYPHEIRYKYHSDGDDGRYDRDRDRDRDRDQNRDYRR